MFLIITHYLFLILKVKKLQDKVAKCKDEVQKSKEKYDQALREINEYNAKYIEDMTVVFEKCQEFERKRLEFFKLMLFAIHGCLNISANPELPIIYEEYRHTIQNADANKDLKWWSNNNGIGMAMNWPVFEVSTFFAIIITSVIIILLIILYYKLYQLNLIGYQSISYSTLLLLPPQTTNPLTEILV